MISQTTPHWYAFVTRPRHEKRVKSHLDGKGVNSYLPLQQTQSHWKDRKKLVEMPLFSCYIFAHLPFTKRYDVLTVPSVVRIVSFEQQPTPVRDEEIESIRRVLEINPYFEVSEDLIIGEKVEIVAGPLKGVIGDFVRFHGQERVAVNIDAISKSLILDVDRRLVRHV